MSDSGEARETRMRRLGMRSKRRGTREMDVILMRFAETRLPAMDDAALDTYEALLAENDQDIYAWLTGRAAPPAPLSGLIADIRGVIGA